MTWATQVSLFFNLKVHFFNVVTQPKTMQQSGILRGNKKNIN